MDSFKEFLVLYESELGDHFRSRIGLLLKDLESIKTSKNTFKVRQLERDVISLLKQSTTSSKERDKNQLLKSLAFLEAQTTWLKNQSRESYT